MAVFAVVVAGCGGGTADLAQVNCPDGEVLQIVRDGRSDSDLAAFCPGGAVAIDDPADGRSVGEQTATTTTTTTTTEPERTHMEEVLFTTWVEPTNGQLITAHDFGLDNDWFDATDGDSSVEWEATDDFLQIEFVRGGLAFMSDAETIMADFGFSPAVWARMERTRPLDGFQTADSPDGYTVTWSFSGMDDSFDIIVERT